MRDEGEHTHLLHAVSQLLIGVVVKVWKRDVDKVPLLLGLEPRVRHHALVEVSGVGSDILTDTQVSHGIGDDVALHDHDSVLGHWTYVRFSVVSAQT